MSLASEIYDALRADTDVADLVGTRVYHNHLETFTKPCVLFRIRNIRNRESLDGAQMGTEELLIVKSYAASEVDVVNLADAVDLVIRYYNSDTVDDVDKENQSEEYDQELKEFVITQEYRLFTNI
jgi:hypothetical protein